MDFTGQYEPDYSDYGREDRTGQATVPWADALGATAANAWVHNPLVYGVNKILDTENDIPASSDDVVDAHTLNQQYGESLGLSFDQPTTRGAADILAANRQAQLQREYTLAHAPSGIGYGAASLATNLAVSAADPLNVAASFVPIVGETRAAMWAARYGSTVARIGEGGIEGATGMAALQPLAYAQSQDQQFQDPYGPLEAFQNVAFGTLLGGGLHAGLGKLSDWLGRASPETREAALRSSVAQMAEGRPVDASAVLASDPRLETPTATEGFGESPPTASYESLPGYQAALDDVKLMEGPEPTDTTIMQAIRQMGGLRTKDANGNPTPEGGDIMNVIGDNPGHVMNVVNNARRGDISTAAAQAGKKPGVPLDEAVTRLKGQGWLHPDADENDLLDLIDRHVNRGETIYHPESEVGQMQAYRDLLDREFTEAGITRADSREEAAAKLAQYRETQGRGFLHDEQGSVLDLENQLSPAAQEALHSDDDWIGSDEWLKSELAAGDEAAVGGVPEAGEDEQSVGIGSGGSEAAGGQAGGARTVPAEFADRLNDARTASEKFGRNQEPSTLAPPDAGAKAEADVKSGLGDDIDQLLQEDEQRVADYHAQGVLTDDEVNAVKEANAADQSLAQSNGDAAKAAARCLWLHP